MRELKREHVIIPKIMPGLERELERRPERELERQLEGDCSKSIHLEEEVPCPVGVGLFFL